MVHVAVRLNDLLVRGVALQSTRCNGESNRVIALAIAFGSTACSALNKLHWKRLIRDRVVKSIHISHTVQFKSSTAFPVRDAQLNRHTKRREREKGDRILLFHIVRLAAVAGRSYSAVAHCIAWTDQTTFISVNALFRKLIEPMCIILENKSVSNGTEHTNIAPIQCAGARRHSALITMRCNPRNKNTAEFSTGLRVSVIYVIYLLLQQWLFGFLKWIEFK